MWINTFKSLRDQTNTLEGRLLAGRVAFRGSATGAGDDAIANADAILALLARKVVPPVELALVQPEATPTKARQTLLALAFSEVAHYAGHAFQSGPAGLLFITQQVIDARAHFAAVRIGTAKISDVFNILPLSTTPSRHWKNLLIANPGKALQGGLTLQGLRALVIDASHPRTLRHLPALFSHPDLCQIPLRIVIAPLHDALLDKKANRITWLWDPPTIAQVRNLLTSKAISLPSGETRKYWLTAHATLDKKFSEIERLLSEATHLRDSVCPPEIVEAWAILYSLRSLTVPLEQAERAWRNSWQGVRLRDRIETLRRTLPTADGELRHFLAMHWTNIVNGLNATYDLLAKAEMSPKFCTLIDALDQFTERRDLPIRIVTPTEIEAPLLASRLAEIDPDLSSAIENGMIEVLTQRQEAKSVAEGNVRTTLLTSVRSSRYRYLDLFTSREVNIIVYYSEGMRDRQRLERSYDRWKIVANERHAKAIPQLKLGTIIQSDPMSWQVPTIEIHSPTESATVTETKELPDTSLDIDWTTLVDTPAPAATPPKVTTANAKLAAGTIVIEDVSGKKIAFPIRSQVDVYRTATDKLVRVPVHTVAAGEFLVVLLDDECDSLFERMCEIGNHRRPLINTLHLERWNIAKSRLFQRFQGIPQLIYHALQDRISVGAQALAAWFGTARDDDGECIAPREEADFRQVATLSGLYRDEDDMHATFLSIHTERVNRRKLGRQLRDAIKSLARGHHFEQALQTAEALNSEVEELMHALELREVAKVSAAT